MKKNDYVIWFVRIIAVAFIAVILFYVIYPISEIQKKQIEILEKLEPQDPQFSVFRVSVIKRVGEWWGNPETEWTYGVIESTVWLTYWDPKDYTHWKDQLLLIEYLGCLNFRYDFYGNKTFFPNRLFTKTLSKIITDFPDFKEGRDEYGKKYVFGEELFTLLACNPKQ